MRHPIDKKDNKGSENMGNYVHNRQILLINDMAGYGKVATAAMLPVLSYMGIPTYNLPTALVSNTLDYGKFNLLDTTDYIIGVFPVWKELGFSFGAIATGFIASERQAKFICSAHASMAFANRSSVSLATSCSRTNSSNCE